MGRTRTDGWRANMGLWHARRAATLAVAGVLLVVAASALLLGCGGNDDQASEERIAREREEAALIAQQEERIKQLERERDEDGDGGREERPADQGSDETVVPSNGADSSPDSSGRSEAADDWPGGSAYTTILVSVGSEDEARRIQAEATGRGLDAGVLFSSAYRSLRPGFWVVFSGTSPAKEDADRRSSRAKSLGYGDAYPRFISG
jgi:hypothetical protein